MIARNQVEINQEYNGAIIDKGYQEDLMINSSYHSDDARLTEVTSDLDLAQKNTNCTMSDKISPFIPDRPNYPDIIHIEKEYNNFERWLKYEKHFDSCICRMHMKTISISWFQLEKFDLHLEKYLQHIKEQLAIRSDEKKLRALALLNEILGKRKRWDNIE